MVSSFESEQIKQWRAQLAAEQDSDDDDVGGLTFAPHLGQRSPPRRAGKGPAHQPLNLRAAAPPVSHGGDESAVIMQHKMQVLQLQLEEREIELQEARRHAGSNGGNAPSSPAGARDAKLKELAKRSKTATMALGRERAQNAQLAAELAQVRKQLSQAVASSGGGSASGGGAEAVPKAAAQDPAVRELKETRERLTAAQSRLHEQKMANQTVKAELQRYQRALAREVGEDANVAKLLEENSGAKGRAQQISLLREQLREMSKKLASASCGVDGASIGEANEGRLAVAEERHRGALQAIEQRQRHEMERLLLREQDLSADLAETRKKSDAQTARIKNLEADSRSKREKLKVMVDKSDADDRLVAMLRAELEKARARSGVYGGATACATSDGGSDADAARRIRDLSARISEQQTQIDRQEQIIVALRDQLAEPPASPGGAGSAVALQQENDKLRELVGLLQDKLYEVEQGHAQ